MNRIFAILSALFLAAVAFGGEPQIVELSPSPKQVEPKPAPLPDTLSVGCYRWLAVKGYDGPITWIVEGGAAVTFETDAATKVIGTVEGQTTPSVNDVPAKCLVLYGVKVGETKVQAWGVVDGKAKLLDSRTFGGGGPRPPPGPEPPKPDNVVPIPGDGLRVLIVFDRLKKLDAKQSTVVYGAEVRNYLDAKCVKGADGTPEYRIYPNDVQGMENETKLWRDAYARKRDGLPWIVVSNGKEGYEGPLPKTEEEAMTLLRKYGGN